MIIDNASLHDLLALAKEIATEERLDLRTAMKQAVQVWPTLWVDTRQFAGIPTGKRTKRPSKPAQRNARAA